MTFSACLSCTSVSKAFTPHVMLLLNDIMVFSGASWTQRGQMGETHSFAWTVKLPQSRVQTHTNTHTHTTPYTVLNCAYCWPRSKANQHGQSSTAYGALTWLDVCSHLSQGESICCDAKSFKILRCLTKCNTVYCIICSEWEEIMIFASVVAVDFSVWVAHKLLR